MDALFLHIIKKQNEKNSLGLSFLILRTYDHKRNCCWNRIAEGTNIHYTFKFWSDVEILVNDHHTFEIDQGVEYFFIGHMHACVLLVNSNKKDKEGILKLFYRGCFNIVR